MKKALRDIIKWAGKKEPPDRADPDNDDPNDAFDAGYKYGMWVAAKRAKEGLKVKVKK